MNSESSIDQAAAWVARLDAGPLNRDEANALLRWIEADAANEGLLEELQRLRGKVRLVLPEMVAAGTLPKRKPRSVLRPVLGWASAVAALFLLAAIWYWPGGAQYATAAAQTRLITLGDGTRVELNARTNLAAHLHARDREVLLREGEGFFSVAKDPSRPFFVTTSAGVVRVTGTVFNVRAEKQNELIVTVVEGSVVVTPATQGHVFALKPGDELSIRGERMEQRHLAPEGLDDELAWRKGQIVFNDTPLQEALERFARHHGRTVEVSPAAQDLRLGGRFRLDDFDAFLRDLQLTLPVRVQHGDDGVVRVVPR